MDKPLALMPRSAGKDAALGYLYGSRKVYDELVAYKVEEADRGVGSTKRAMKAHGPGSVERWQRWDQIVEWTKTYEFSLDVVTPVKFHTGLNLKHLGVRINQHDKTLDVQVLVRTKDNGKVVFRETADTFPSEAMHAKLALTVAAGGVREHKTYNPDLGGSVTGRMSSNMQTDIYGSMAMSHQYINWLQRAGKTTAVQMAATAWHNKMTALMADQADAMLYGCLPPSNDDT